MSHDYLYPMAIWGLFKRIQLETSIRKTSSSNSSLKEEVTEMCIFVMVKAMALKLPSQTQTWSPVHLESPISLRAFCLYSYHK